MFSYLRLSCLSGLCYLGGASYVMRCSYFSVHETMRGITGIGEGNGPYMVVHDGFQGLNTWYGLLPGSDRIAMGKLPCTMARPRY